MSKLASLFGRCFAVTALTLALATNAEHLPAKAEPDNPQLPAHGVFQSVGSKVVELISRRGGEPIELASGILLSDDGYIVTNYHALQGADSIEVRYFPDPQHLTRYEVFTFAEILYLDFARDIAVIKIEANALPFLACERANTCKPQIGEQVYAIGSPEGLTDTISNGIVSALRNTGSEIVIQHTAPISPGSSGGALVDANGNLLGMNSWQVESGQNLNFAISAQYLYQALQLARDRSISLPFPEAGERADSRTRDSAPGQSMGASAPAIAALKAIAANVEACPKTIWFEWPHSGGPLSGARIYFDTPVSVVWNVVPIESVRSPYMGYIEFTVNREFWVPDDVYARHKDSDSRLYKRLLFTPQPSLKYRYEFDVGPNGLKLAKMLSQSMDESSWHEGPDQEACSPAGCFQLCWDAAAQHGDSKAKQAAQ